MRKILAAALVAAAALPATSYAGTEGCVTEYFLQGDDTEYQPIVVVNPDGSITIYPPRVPPVKPMVQAAAQHLVGFVNCVV